MPRLLLAIALVLVLVVPAPAGVEPAAPLSRVLPSEGAMRAELAAYCRQSAQELAAATDEFEASLRAESLPDAEQEALRRGWNDEHRRLLDEGKAIRRSLVRQTGAGAAPAGGLDPLYGDWHRYRRLRVFLPLAGHWWKHCAADDFKTAARAGEWEKESATLSRELKSLAAVVKAATGSAAFRQVEGERRRAALVPNRPGTREALARIRAGTSLLDRKEEWDSLTQEERDRLLVKRKREEGSRR